MNFDSLSPLISATFMIMLSVISILYRRNDRTTITFSMFTLSLGLAISAQIIQHHGGTIDVESEYGKGSVFRIKLPVKN